MVAYVIWTALVGVAGAALMRCREKQPRLVPVPVRARRPR
jgi:hypothetical protein